MTPLLTKSSKFILFYFKSVTIWSVNKIRPSSTTSKGLTNLPESVLIMIYPYYYLSVLINAIFTNFYINPFLLIKRILRIIFVSIVYPINEPSTITLYPFPCKIFPYIIPKFVYLNLREDVETQVVKAKFLSRPHP